MTAPDLSKGSRDFEKGRVTGEERRALRIVGSAFQGEVPPRSVAAVAQHAIHDRTQVEVTYVCRHTAGTVLVPYREFAALWWDAPTKTAAQRAARRRGLSALVHRALARDHKRRGLVFYRGAYPEWQPVVIL